jgi:UDP-N-acetylglucosamine 4-epimerase
MNVFEQVCTALRSEPRNWLVTGAAGFVGSHLTEALLDLGQRVVGLDDLSTGSRQNLEHVRQRVGEEAWKRFTFREGSVADAAECREAIKGADYVLHHGGFISVPLSVEDPAGCHTANVTGTLNLLLAARENAVKRFVYASSSAVYGTDARMPKIEEQIGRPLSPYGASKLMDELYAGLFADHYGVASVGFRYFNIFGPRQSPDGAYAAVIPQWITTLMKGGQCRIHGNGEQTRDFCHVGNVVQANILAAVRERPVAADIYNVAYGECISLNQLHEMIARELAVLKPGLKVQEPLRGATRAGDILHSGADIGKIRKELGFEPAVAVEPGLQETIRWYVKSC